MGHLRKGNLELRRKSAKERDVTYKALTIPQRLATLDKKFGKDLGAKRERARLATKLKAQNEAPKVVAKPKDVPKSPKDKFEKKYSKKPFKEVKKEIK